MRACPFCSEEIQDTAVICRWCKNRLDGVNPAAAPPASPERQPNLGERLLLPVGRSGWAIAAGYLGLVSLIVVFAPIALIISVIAMVHLKKHPELHGWGRAIFGLIMGLIFSVGCVALLVLMLTEKR